MKTRKWNIALSVLGWLSLAGLNSSAQASPSLDQVVVSNLVAQAQASAAAYAIEWKVGDQADFILNLGGFGKGTLKKSVTQDQGDSLWIVQDVEILFQKQKVEILLSKVDGKILKMLVNGQEQEVPNDSIEIISQEYTEVTVPAGKFEAVYIVAKTADAPKIEVWINPRDTVMEGTLKQITQTQGITMTMELKSFKRN